MLKEDGRKDQAQSAYEEAVRLRPQDAGARLQLAHLHKNAGELQVAARYFAGLVAQGSHTEEAAGELAEIVRPVAPLDANRLCQILRDDDAFPVLDLASTKAALSDVLVELERDAAVASGSAAVIAALELISRIGLESATDTKQQAAGTRPIVFDISDLVAHFRLHRLPTGIQRVQIEVLAAALKAHRKEQVGICCFVDGRDHWIELPVQRFLKLAYLSSSGSEADWQAAQGSLFLHLAIDESYDLPEHAVLVNLGTSWWIYDYFRLIREAREQKGVAYIPMVYDLIPILAPQYCVSGITQDYVSWAVGVFQHADGYLAISESTKRDLIAVAAQLGHTVSPNKVEVIALDADFRRRAAAPLPATALRRWQLEEGSYALFVSTIEARKNHSLAFDAWAELIRRHGRVRVPRLVCVGRNGWLNEQAFARLAANSELRAHVTIIYQASDEELALLYKCCRFTVYPSHYEGWGLPVTESLCYGRVPVVADNSSLPEAGGNYALMFESDSIPALVKAVESVAFDDDLRQHRERRILAEFQPRRWESIFHQMSAAITRLTMDHPVDTAAMRGVNAGEYYPTKLYRGLRIWSSLASGEVFRAGEGWLWPETDGCRTTLAGGELRVTTSWATQPLRLYMHVRGLSTSACPFSLLVQGETILHTRLRPGEQRWVTTDLPEHAGPDIAVTVKGDTAEWIEMSTGGTVKRLKSSLTVIGFALCLRDDEEARTRFVEAAALGGLDDINAYRQPVSGTVW